jgi:hypothetical protein
LARPIILGVVGDSAAGKTTITRGLVRVLGEDRVTHVCTDDYHLEGDGLKLDERDGELHLFVPGKLDPSRGAEIEGAIWESLHFASHLRTERLGEFTIGTELHRSESLALIQMLVLYHLFTATASVALGGSGTRVPAPAG